MIHLLQGANLASTQLLDWPHLDSQFKRHFMTAQLRLGAACGVHPDCLVLSGVNLNGWAVDGGAFGDIYKGFVQGHEVAIKVLRVFNSSDRQKLLKVRLHAYTIPADESTFQAFSREVTIWEQLSHPNVLKFYGVFYCLDRLSFVSPWMENGNILKYLENEPETERFPLVSSIHHCSCALSYPIWQ